MVSVALTEVYPPRRDQGCAVVQVRVGDGREFSLLTATPGWFEKTFVQLGLRYYFGPSILFVRRLDLGIVRKAVRAMAADGDGWLCLLDTPRRTLPEVLSQFKARRSGY